MKDLNDADICFFDNILETLTFDQWRHSPGTRRSARFKYFKEILPQRIANFKSRIANEPEFFQGEAMKNANPSNIIDTWTRLEVLLGKELSRHTDILTEASNLLDVSYKRDETQNNQQYRNALDISYTKWRFFSTSVFLCKKNGNP